MRGEVRLDALSVPFVRDGVHSLTRRISYERACPLADASGFLRAGFVHLLTRRISYERVCPLTDASGFLRAGFVHSLMRRLPLGGLRQLWQLAVKGRKMTELGGGDRCRAGGLW